MPGRKNIKKELCRLILELAKLSNIILSLPEYMFVELHITPNKRLKLFDYSTKQFSELDIIVGRPGIGLVTDCLRSNTYIMPIFEKNNIEMIHNSNVISINNWGLELGQNLDYDHILFGINKLLKTKYNKIETVKFGGIVKLEIG